MFLYTERTSFLMLQSPPNFVLTVMRMLNKVVGAAEACRYTHVKLKQCH